MNHALTIAGCKTGNRLAQKQLFELYSKNMMLVCRRYVPNNHDAEELLLTGFLKFFESVGKFVYKNDSSLCAWLKQIMINECLMFLRKQNRIKIVEENQCTDVELDADTLSSINAKHILDVINNLPDGYRIVFNLFVIEGYSHSEIAQMLGISTGTSKSQLMRAKVSLQKLLTDKGMLYETRWSG